MAVPHNALDFFATSHHSIVWPLPRFHVPQCLALKSYDKILHPTDWIYGLQLRFTDTCSAAMLTCLGRFPIELFSQLIEQQWQIAVTNVHRTELQAKCIPSYPTVALATHKDNVILTIGWPRHFAASVQELQEYTCELQFNLDEMIKFLHEHWQVPPQLFGACHWTPALQPFLTRPQRRFMYILLMLESRLQLLNDDLWFVILEFVLKCWPMQWHNKHGMGCLPPSR